MLLSIDPHERLVGTGPASGGHVHDTLCVYMEHDIAAYLLENNRPHLARFELEGFALRQAAGLGLVCFRDVGPHIHNRIVGHAPDLLKGMLELRGIGIVDVARMYGANCLMDKHVVDLVINLVKYDPNDEYERLGEVSSRFTRILDILIPTIVLPVSTGRSMRILIESAVTNFILKEEGYNATTNFKNKLYTYLENKDQEDKA